MGQSTRLSFLTGAWIPYPLCLLMIIWNVVTKVKKLECADDHLSSLGPEVHNVYKFASMSQCMALVMLCVSVDFWSQFVFYSGTVAARNKFDCLCIYWAAGSYRWHSRWVDIIPHWTLIHCSNSTCSWSSWPSIAFSSTYSHPPKTKIL